MEFVDTTTLETLQAVLWDTHREIEEGTEVLPLEHHKTLGDLHALLEQAEVLLQELLSKDDDT